MTADFDDIRTSVQNNENNFILFEEQTAYFLNLESKSSMSPTVDSNNDLDFRMSTYKALTPAFQGKLLSVNAKRTQQVGVPDRSKALLSEIVEVRESTESSGSKEQSDCSTPTLQFAPSVKKLRYHKNSTM